MRILYAIQGTGNGHLARATEIVPILRKYGEVDVLVSGIQGDLHLPFEVKYRLFGLSFIFGKKGGVSLFKTLAKARIDLFLKDVFKIPVKDYDLVLNDFEPVAAWACKLRGIESVGISHQNAVTHSKAPRPSKVDNIAELILKYYAPSKINFGFHFLALDENNFTPIIRSSIFNAMPRKGNHYTVYLPAYSDEEIINVLSKIKESTWEVFSKHSKKAYEFQNIKIYPVELDRFTHSFINCCGVLCNAGFETPAEAIYMGKKLCVIPMKNQYEQSCNATMLQKLDVKVLNSLRKSGEDLNDWVRSEQAIQIKYPNQTERIVHELLSLSIKRQYQSQFSGAKLGRFHLLKMRHF